ncbi:hypothetical protein D3P96_04070 [Weissella viridescens]|uniref:Regulatory protein YycH-like domain-containing protein n=1 Tax=Weissella viridescens TaxID=1629 RepID=A0A3P2RBH6_WEIVI|nr:two-component system regulatory protein YycI [Weissella viridescens]RRG18109.1 hypothetical protein D3P96_04070 [Weissella viridescens]
MNLRKLLWAFLYTFLILDAVLLFQWFEVSQPLINPGSKRSVQQEMQMDGIEYGKLNSRPVSGAYLSGDDDKNSRIIRKTLAGRFNINQSGNSLVMTPKTTIRLGKSRQDAINNAQKMVADSQQVVGGKDYLYDAFLTQYGTGGRTRSSESANASSNGYTIVFSQKAESLSGTPLFSTQRGRIQVNLDRDFNVKNYTQTHITNIEKLRDISTLITEQDAVMNAYQYNAIPNNSQIVACRLSYRLMTVVRDDNIFSPVWSIVIKDNAGDTSIVAINAVNGTLIH